MFFNRIQEKDSSLEDIIELLRKDLSLAHASDNDGNYAVHYAVLSGDRDKIELFSKEQVMLGFADDREIIATTPGINAVNNDGQTPLHLLMKDEVSGIGMLKYIIDDLGGDINAVDNDGDSLMHYAISYGRQVLQDIARMTIIGCLGHEMKEFNSANNDGVTPLHLASYLCSSDIVDFLLEKEANVNYPDIKGFKPIHYAACDQIADLGDKGVGEFERTISLLENNGAVKDIDFANILKLKILPSKTFSPDSVTSCGFLPSITEEVSSDCDTPRV